MRELAAEGTSIVFITHKLREVKAVADRITVIRQGKVVGEATPDASTGELASMMVGRDVALTVDKDPATPKEVVLRATNLRAYGSLGQLALDEATVEVRAGEVVAIAGVQGNGQTELVEALIGLRPLEGGTIELDGDDITGHQVSDILARGVGYIPEDRRKDGLVGEFSIEENLMMDRFHDAPFVKRFSLDLSGREHFAKEAIDEFDVRTPSSTVPASTLSGGNQQKVVVARELTKPLRLLIASQPTRGVDVGSIEFIHQRLIAARDSGVAVVIVSTELDEVFALADRIVVMYRGRMIGEVTPEISREKLGEMMAGVVAV
jgi:simple sugar transport system ATP-binding protein